MLTWDQVWGAVRGMGGLLASKLPSIMSCAWPYASLAQDEMTVRPHHCCRMRPSAVISHMTENVSLSHTCGGAAGHMPMVCLFTTKGG